MGGAGVRLVRVRLVQAGGVRAERAVDEEVTGRADRAQLPDAPGVLAVGDALGPVAEDPRPLLLRGEPEQTGEVVLVGDVGTGALVERADPERRGVRAGRTLRLGALRGRDPGVGGGAYGVVCRAGQGASAR